MARPTTKKPAARRPINSRRPATRRAKKSSKMYILYFMALALVLTIFIGLSIYTLSEDRNAAAANNGESNNSKDIAKKDSSKQEQLKEVAAVSDMVRDNDILSKINLILMDYEVAESSISEVVRDNDAGQDIFIHIALVPSLSKEIRGTLKKILKANEYKTKDISNKLIASDNINNIEIVFFDSYKELKEVKSNKSEPERPKTVAKVAPKKNVKALVVKEKAKAVKANDGRPTPPARSEVIVRMAILLDDAGANYEIIERFLMENKYPVAVAVLPYLQYSKEIAYAISSYKKTLFLHLPMQPKSYPTTDPGEGALLVNMPEVIVKELTKKALDSFDVYVDGVNNHMGSAFTEDREKMRQALSVVKGYTDLFVDSKTSSGSVAYDECVSQGMRCAMNNHFIDNQNDVNKIIEKLYEAAEYAKKHGEVLVIGHMRSKTLDALEIALPILEDRKIIIVPVEQVVK